VCIVFFFAFSVNDTKEGGREGWGLLFSFNIHIYGLAKVRK
jgi:hypothetical protein